MAKRLVFMIFASLILIPSLAAEPGAPAPGKIWGSGHLDQEQYVLALHFEQDLYSGGTLKAIKITFEPSGTVAALIYDEACSAEEVDSFLDGKASLSFMKVMSFIRLDPRIYYYPQARHLAEDTAVRVEYLVSDNADDGDVSPVDGPEVLFNDIAGTDFFLTPAS